MTLWIHTSDCAIDYSSYRPTERAAQEGSLKWSAPHFDCSPRGRKMRREDPWASTDAKPTEGQGFERRARLVNVGRGRKGDRREEHRRQSLAGAA